jgi:hypothetical protein
LDKGRGNPSMRPYLETMGVNELALEAHEKGEAEFDTFQTIALGRDRVEIIKRSRVNADIRVDLELGVEHVVLLPPGNREKKSLALSDHPGHLRIQSSLHTLSGLARITETKNLLQEEERTILVQELTITNDLTGQTSTTTRYFVPYLKTPPHLEVVASYVDTMDM